MVVHSADGHFLLIERAANPGYWQSVTGSQEQGETLAETASRELQEETGLVAQSKICLSGLNQSSYPLNVLVDHQYRTEYEIFPEWRHRYAPGVTQNIEHLFSFKLASPRIVQLSPSEHHAQTWLTAQAAASACFSPSNQSAIIHIARQAIVTNSV